MDRARSMSGLSISTSRTTSVPQFADDRDSWTDPEVDRSLCLTVVVAGASGDLAKKKTFPALYFLFKHGFLCPNTRILGYARSDLTAESLHKRLLPNLKKEEGEGGEQNGRSIEDFLKLVSYVRGEYDGDEGWSGLERAIREAETRSQPSAAKGRLFYLALPPTVYPQVCAGLATHCAARGPVEIAEPTLVRSLASGTALGGPGDAGGLPGAGEVDPFAPSQLPPGSWVRVVVEKPFGHDSASSELLAQQLAPLFPEAQLYRIDHYLGKEMTQNMLVVRFANTLFSPLWNRTSVANVQITFKEDFGTQGRGGYFDSFGIIRDVLQNHICQLLAYVAMEKPVSTHPDDVRDQKVQVLRSVLPVDPADVVVGQYVGDGLGDPDAADPAARHSPGHEGYLDDPTVPAGSRTPTFASLVLYINNDRWAGVPFILRAGKALDERKAEIRIQFKEPPHTLYRPSRGGGGSLSTARGRGPATAAGAATRELRLSSPGTRGGAGDARARTPPTDPSSPPASRAEALEIARQAQGERNELVVRLQPDEAMYAKLVIKRPGLGMDTTISELDLDYRTRYPDALIPDAYPKLILDAVRGDQQHFVRRDELRAAWAIFTPILQEIDAGRIPIESYRYGSRGPEAANALRERVGWVKNVRYDWVGSPRSGAHHSSL